MFRFILNIATTAVVLGLILALLITFDWDVTAIVEWAWGLGVSVVTWIADWFMSMPWFQDAVR